MTQPILTREQVRRVDDLAIHRVGIAGVVLMENAGRNAAALIRESFGDGGRAVILCGPGNNGGDGLVVARHLHNNGWSVRAMVTAGAERLTPDALANFRVVEAMGLGPVVARDATCQSEFVRSITPDDVVVDALLGTGFRGTVRSPTAELIVHVDRADKRAVVALDIPSGLDCDTGVPSNATLRADLTVTFVALKPGLIAPGAARYAGRVAVVDIGAPRELVAEVMRGLV